MHDADRKSTFLNRRDWGSYLIALHNAAVHPKFMEAMRSGQAWFSEGALHASTWVVGRQSFPEKFSAG